ncbi:MAG: alpha/beta hydrolase [Actinomycetia bacterium]|nr:alpha/beta hydrolase [Actinomycetes bacterium]
MTQYERLEIPVDGGALAAGRWGSGDTVIVASHGITANHLSWQAVGDMLDAESHGAVSLVAVDHRGRAGSADTPGEYGLAQHADDAVAVLDHMGIDKAVFVGHSMGAFVVANVAERHPDRVERLVLVDGGVPFVVDLPGGFEIDELDDEAIEAIVQSVIGPALDRLNQRWATIDEYVDFFRAHPAFQPPNEWTPAVEAYVTYDAVTTPEGDVRSSVAKGAVLVDGASAIVDPISASAIERVSVPTTLLWCPRGILDQTPGLYAPEQITAVEAEFDHLTVRLIDSTNHYTVLVADAGAAAIVSELLANA